MRIKIQTKSFSKIENFKNDKNSLDNGIEDYIKILNNKDEESFKYMDFFLNYEFDEKDASLMIILILQKIIQR